MSVTRRVNAALKASAALAALVGTRIEPGRLLEGSALPALVFALVGGTGVGELAGDSGVAVCSVQVDAYAIALADADEILRVVTSVFSSALHATAGVPHQVWDPDPTRFRLTCDYQVSHDGND